VLVIGTRFDPATPYRQTRPYAELFPDGRVLTVEGWGHTSIGKSACADIAIAGYLVGGDAPRDGAECAQDVVPFTAPPAARGAARPDVPPGLPLR
jgi:TAP-like protein